MKTLPFNVALARDMSRAAYIKRLLRYGVSTTAAFKCITRLCP